MTDNNKFIPKLPETKTEIILNQEQQTPQEQKSTTEKVVDSVKEAVVPTVYASDSKGKGSSSGRGSPKIVQKDIRAEAARHESFEREQTGQQNLKDAGCELQ